MAASSVTISNTYESIMSKTIPGKFTVDKCTFVFPRLSYYDSRKNMHYWTISVELQFKGTSVPIEKYMIDNPTPPMDGYSAIIKVEALQANGKVRDSTPTVITSGKNLGKKNATNCLTQAIRNALGLYNKHLTRTKNNSEGVTSNMPPPMLVKRMGDSKESTLTEEDFKLGITVQRKLNGVHYIAYANETLTDICRYSRTGKIYPGHNHLAEELLNIIKCNFAPDVNEFELIGLSPEIIEAYNVKNAYFDGELYEHGKTLNWISGKARKGAEAAQQEELLSFHVFDIMFPAAKALGHEMTSKMRQLYLTKVIESAPPQPHIIRVENFTNCNSVEDINQLVKQFLADNYEGAIARKDNAFYQYGHNNYHSANLVKIKPIYDAEFEVIGFTQGTTGKDLGALVWICKLPTNEEFNVVPKNMTYPIRKKLYEALQVIDPNTKLSAFETYIKGKMLTVEYAELSPKNIPLQAKALLFRTYENGADEDTPNEFIRNISK